MIISQEILQNNFFNHILKTDLLWVAGSWKKEVSVISLRSYEALNKRQKNPFEEIRECNSCILIGHTRHILLSKVFHNLLMMHTWCLNEIIQRCVSVESRRSKQVTIAVFHFFWMRRARCHGGWSDDAGYSGVALVVGVWGRWSGRFRCVHNSSTTSWWVISSWWVM